MPFKLLFHGPFNGCVSTPFETPNLSAFGVRPDIMKASGLQNLRKNVVFFCGAPGASG